eukprot:2442966-Pyramimonas_sp.AAC.1
MVRVTSHFRVSGVYDITACVGLGSTLDVLGLSVSSPSVEMWPPTCGAEEEITATAYCFRRAIQKPLSQPEKGEGRLMGKEPVSCCTN